MSLLSEQQKSAIRLYLGYPDGFRYRNTRLESVMDNISDEAVKQIESILENLASLDVTIVSSGVVSASGVKRVDEITFFDPINGVNIGFKNGKEAGKWLVGRLSIILGTPINASAFGAAGYPGDSFMPGFGGGGIGGGYGLG